MGGGHETVSFGTYLNGARWYARGLSLRPAANRLDSPGLSPSDSILAHARRVQPGTTQ
ncbi:hypothetical protein STXM2123_460 [Streptomyces sp. F-3]|nr:hypothetical protein STXM2123_460 [Streptomyces sp. F-3]